MTRVLCVGDRVFPAASLGDAARAAFGEDTEVVTYESRWPDEPFGEVDGVREASGDVAGIAELAGDVDVLLTHLGPVSRTVLEAAPRLRAVGVTRGGPVNADLDVAASQGVPVVFLPGRNLGAVAEFTVGVMVTLMRNIAPASRTLADGTWDARYFRFDETGPELRACTVGLVGLGAVGLRVAELLTAFGSRVVGHDPFADEETVRDRGIEPMGLDDLLACSDVVSVHARLSDDTRRMFDADAFAAMRPGAFFVNTARGELVDEAALTAALDSGHLGGAALDVFDPEPPGRDNELVRRSNVVATPHLAGSSKQVSLESVQRVAQEVAAFLADGTLEHCANPSWSENGTGGTRS
jgi:D-3-phosphoglycerate dehydrogenase